MITEDYVSFEVAKLLKEKGFDEPVLYYFRYGKCEPTYPVEGILSKNSDLFDAYSIPTLQMVMKWLREVHHYYIQVMLDSWACGGHSGYYVVIQKNGF